MRVWMIVLAMAFSTVALAKPPAQGRACDARTRCDAGLTCVAHRDGKSTCEITCAANAKCPEDQRCVKDGGDMVCRPINDGVGLATATERKAPAGQGKACDARSRCDGELQCVKHRDGRSTCELVCAQTSTCPEDQRCVKDGGEQLCRPITDLDL